MAAWYYLWMSDRDVLLGLVREYFALADGELIQRHTETVVVCEIPADSVIHPHASAKMNITRRALKHVVKSRRKELLKNHVTEVALDLILEAVSAVSEVIQRFDFYELEAPDKHFYSKDFSERGMPNVRILLEQRDAELFITSIHFQKRTKNTTCVVIFRSSE